MPSTSLSNLTGELILNELPSSLPLDAELMATTDGIATLIPRAVTDRLLNPATHAHASDSSATIIDHDKSHAAPQNNNIPPSLPARSPSVNNASQITETPPTRRKSRVPSMPGRKFIGDWELGQTIGQGSSGKVKIAKNNVTGKTVRYINAVCC